MSKCNCYHERSERRYIFNTFTGIPETSYLSTYGVCYGTKECDVCGCEGDETRCSFYPEKREKAIQANIMAFEKPACIDCPSNPKNGGNGICACILGQDVIC